MRCEGRRVESLEDASQTSREESFSKETENQYPEERASESDKETENQYPEERASEADKETETQYPVSRQRAGCPVLR